jgi:hypothetical protein
MPETAQQVVVRHFRQILVWPLQLMPLRAGDQVQRHFEALEQIGPGNPWQEVLDEFTGDPTQFQERHYREFVTFLPYVQRFLYGQGRSSTSLRGYGESPIRVYRRSDIAFVRVTCPDGVSVDLCVKHVDLHFFYDVDVVILAVEVHADDLPLSRVQEIMYRFGRTFPAQWDQDGRASHCMRRVEWIGNQGEVLAVSDFDDRAKYLTHACEHRASTVGAHWEYLLQPMAQHHSEQPGLIRYRQLEYHRLPKMTYLSFDDPFALTREDFVRLGLALRPDDGQGLQYSEKTIDDFERDHCYDRFWSPARRDPRSSTRIVCTGHSFIMIGSQRLALFADPEMGLLGQFRHQYFQLGLIAHFHRAALLMMSDRLVVAVSRLDIRSQESIRFFKRSIRQTMEIFLRFNHRYWFHEVSKQVVAKDLFRLWSHQLGNDALFTELREEMQDMSHYLDSDDARRQSDTVLRLTVVTILGLVGTIVTGFLGMNLIAEAEQPLLVKIAYFAIVFVPTLALTLYTVQKSRALSEFLDTMSDERLPMRNKLAALVRVWRKPPQTGPGLVDVPARTRRRKKAPAARS